MNKTLAIISKEWGEVFKNRFVAFTSAFLPLLLTVLPLGVLYFSQAMGEFEEEAMSDLPRQFTLLCQGLTSPECMQYFIVAEFMILYLIVPVVIPMTIASYSIVGEKTTQTLEPLLAAPITTLELLAGKALAAALPGVWATWGGFLIFSLGVRFLGLSPAVVQKSFSPLWIMAIFVIGPLLALAGVSLAVMISSRVNDPRAAEQISGFFVLPIIILMLGQTSGLFLIDDTFVLWMAAALVILDGVLFFFASRLFERETILTRWK